MQRNLPRQSPGHTTHLPRGEAGQERSRSRTPARERGQQLSGDPLLPCPSTPPASSACLLRLASPRPLRLASPRPYASPRPLRFSASPTARLVPPRPLHFFLASPLVPAAPSPSSTRNSSPRSPCSFALPVPSVTLSAPSEDPLLLPRIRTPPPTPRR